MPTAESTKIQVSTSLTTLMIIPLRRTEAKGKLARSNRVPESNHWRVPWTVSGLPLPEHVSSCWLAKDSPYCDNLDGHSTCQLSERGHFLIHTALRVITPYRLSRFAVAPRRCPAVYEPRPLQRRDARGDTGAETTPTTKSKSVRRPSTGNQRTRTCERGTEPSAGA